MKNNSFIVTIVSQKGLLVPRSFIASALIFVVAVFSLFAGQKTVIFGGEEGWSNLSTMDGVASGKGRFGFESIELATKKSEIDYDTDLLLTFDSGVTSDKLTNYELIENHLVPTKNAVKGKGAALSRGESKGIILAANSSSAFGHQGLSGSFTIEFWISPSLAENGEKIYSWRSSISYSEYAEYQMITAFFSNNRLEWKFKNVFPSFDDSEVFLRGYSAIVPGEWSRHTVSFDEETGCLEYLVDGRTESIKYITSTRHENGSVCMPVIGKHTILEICPQYTGKIDNVRILRSAYKKEDSNIFASGNEPFRTSGGRFVTNPVLVSRSATLNSLNALMSVPSQTEVRLFVRSGDNCYGWTDNSPQWKEVYSGEDILDVSGLYFQVAAELLPDGSGVKTPSVTQLTLNFTEAELPMPPFIVDAQAGDGEVTLSWNYSVDDSAGGYYVYYGNRPGEYLGRAAVQGSSPINAGNRTSITLSGLTNGTIYYFAVSSYSKLDGTLTGELSKEVYARPSKKLAKN